MKNQTKTIRLNRKKDDWLSPILGQSWICDEAIQELFHIPKTINTIYVILSTQKPRGKSYAVLYGLAYCGVKVEGGDHFGWYMLTEPVEILRELGMTEKNPVYVQIEYHAKSK